MRIVFDKIGQSPKPFDLEVDAISLKGTLTKKGYHRIRLEANLQGYIQVNCDRCGDIYIHDMHNPLVLTLSDEVIETEDDLDIIEFIDGMIDLKFIIQSEISSVENSYHNCKKCENDDEIFEREF